MIDNKSFKLVRYSDYNYEDCTQFKEFNYEQELTPIQSRLYYLMVFGKQPRMQSESLYGWGNRIELPKSTTYGIFTKGNQNMHLAVAEKIAEATGANALWIKDGIGEAFTLSENLEQPIASTQSVQPTDKPATIQKKGLTLSTSINLEKLQEVFETTEEILRTQNRTMPALARGEFTVMLYKMFIDETAEPFNAELLQHSTYAVEDMLEKQRLTMSLEKKTLLIVAIYTMYIDTPAGVQQLLQTAGVLLRRIA